MNKNVLYIRTKLSFFGEIAFPIIIKTKICSETILCHIKSDIKVFQGWVEGSAGKVLSCTPEDPSSAPWTHVETSNSSMYVSPVLGKEERQAVSCSLIHSALLQFSEQPCFKNWCGKQLRMLTSELYACAHIVYRHAHGSMNRFIQPQHTRRSCPSKRN